MSVLAAPKKIWDFSGDHLFHPVTNHSVQVNVNFLGGVEWEVEIIDLDDNSILVSEVICMYDSNYYQIAADAVAALEFM